MKVRKGNVCMSMLSSDDQIKRFSTSEFLHTFPLFIAGEIIISAFLHPSICLLDQFWISSHLEGVAGEIFISPNHLRKLLLPTNPWTVPNPEGSVHQSVDFRLGGVTSDPSLCKHKVSVSVFPSFGSFLLITYQITNPADSCMATSATFSALHLVLVDSG